MCDAFIITSTKNTILKCSFEIDEKDPHASFPPPHEIELLCLDVVVFNLSQSRLARIRMDI